MSGVRLRGWPAVGIVIVALILIGFAIIPARLQLSALPNPGATETFLANHVRDWLVRRAARRMTVSLARNDAAAITAGGGLFDMECAFCHGKDGRASAAVGQSMYPRAVNLAAPAVQSRSDRELFWIVKHGIRLTGMPGFAAIDSDDQIWQVVYFLRTLPSAPKP